MIAVSWGRAAPPHEKKKPLRPVMAAIISAVADEHGVSVHQLCRAGRGMKEYALARQEAYYRCHKAGAGLKAIAAMFSDRDHSTIHHGIKAHEKRIAALSTILPISTLPTD